MVRSSSRRIVRPPAGQPAPRPLLGLGSRGILLLTLAACSGPPHTNTASESESASAEDTGPSTTDTEPLDTAEGPLAMVAFSTEVPFGSGTDITAMVTLADLDGDGIDDLILANGRHWSEANTWVANPGDRTLNTPVAFTSASASYAVQAADFDGDGTRDLAVANSSTHPSGIVWGTSTGPGTSLDAIVDPASYRNVLVVDLNADDAPDLVFAGLSVPNLVLLNDGTGSFTSTQVGTGSDNTVGLAAGDIDGDGDIDLALANRDPGVLTLYLGEGDGDFSSAETVEVGASDDDVRWVELVDVDGDTRLDILAIQYEGQDRVLLQGDALDFSTVIPLGDPDSPTYTAAAADLNDDGRMDLIAGRKGEPSVIYLQDRDLDFSSTVSFGSSGPQTYSVVAGDLDGDGKLDLVVANSGTENVVYFQD